MTEPVPWRANARYERDVAALNQLCICGHPSSVHFRGAASNCCNGYVVNPELFASTWTAGEIWTPGLRCSCAGFVGRTE